MLLSAPTEVTEMILSLLDLPSLAKTSQTCQRLRHLSIPPLYRTVTLTSWTHLDHFFVPTPIPNLSLSLALERATARRADLDSIHHLILDLPEPKHGTHSAFNSLPKLLSLRSQPLQLDSFRLSCSGSLHPFPRIFKAINPRKLYLHRWTGGGPDADYGVLLSLGASVWNRVEEWTFSAYLPCPRWNIASLGGRSIKSTPFKNVKKAVLLIPEPETDANDFVGGQSILPIVERFVSFCPRLTSLRIVAPDDEWKGRIEVFVEKEYGGRGKFKGLVVDVEVGEGVYFNAFTERTVWPGDPQEEIDNDTSNLLPYDDFPWW